MVERDSGTLVANVRNSGAVFGIRLPNSGALSVLIILVHIPICQWS